MTLLATPISSAVLRTLADGSKRLVDLRRACGSPAQTTLRAYLKDLEGLGALDRHRNNAFPGAMECELTPAGRELLGVAAVLERWLEAAPDGPLPIGSDAGKAAIKALSDGWSSSMLRALAARPLSLTELDGIIPSLSYPSLERRLAAMKLAGQVEACRGNGQGTPYTPTSWLRRGVGPLAVAARWERHHLPADTAPIGRIDIEGAFLLTLPLVTLSPELSGSCRHGIEMGKGRDRRLIGAMAQVEEGRVTSCSVRLDSSADAWLTGSVGTWLHAVIDADVDGLEPGGDQRLARALFDGLHASLFSLPATQAPATT